MKDPEIFNWSSMNRGNKVAVALVIFALAVVALAVVALAVVAVVLGLLVAAVRWAW